MTLWILIVCVGDCLFHFSYTSWKDLCLNLQNLYFVFSYNTETFNNSLKWHLSMKAPYFVKECILKSVFTPRPGESTLWGRFTKTMLLGSWTFRGLVESVPSMITAALVAQEGPSQTTNLLLLIKQLTQIKMSVVWRNCEVWSSSQHHVCSCICVWEWRDAH